MIKQLAYKLFFKERSSSKSYTKYLQKHCRKFGKDVVIFDPHKVFIDKDALHFIEIGDNCQIASGVKILAHDESYSVCGLKYGYFPREQKITKIGNNVFIGMNSIILMGSEIGDNVIIGAGSIVSGKVESDSVYAGNRAKKIKTLDEYFAKHKEDFENSAYLFIKSFIEKNNRKPNFDEIHVYRLLFENKLDKAVNKPDYIVEKVIKANSIRYSSIDEFLVKYESKTIN